MNPYFNTIQGASLVFLLILLTILLLASLLLPKFRDDLWIIGCWIETSLNRIVSAIRGLFLRVLGNTDGNRDSEVPADRNAIRMVDLESGRRRIAGGDALVERVASFDGEESI
ncbi:uncharacterized protein Bfra_011035 [Botrytis fragariae]|uniref:Uncharacterized protein n=1 Tax=Botrytis fragariae TaxID=1964551 RepID=A0A8H6EFD2_9HELO|nr:uncharacterized protein Bfra_011035 [Botrytis fragariae]KAF5869835.1 hypothetical protein Bfra_011035 [Botrytis fragariae]